MAGKGGAGTVKHNYTRTFHRLVATVQNSVADCGQVEVEEWQELVGDIWDKRLPHFRDFSGNGGTYLFKPRKGTYGCGDGQEGEDERSQFDVLDDDSAAQDPPMRGNEESPVHDIPMRGNEKSAINDRPMRGNKESAVNDRPMKGNKESPVHDRPMRGNADTAVAASDERESVHKGMYLYIIFTFIIKVCMICYQQKSVPLKNWLIVTLWTM